MLSIFFKMPIYTNSTTYRGTLKMPDGCCRTMAWLLCSPCCVCTILPAVFRYCPFLIFMIFSTEFFCPGMTIIGKNHAPNCVILFFLLLNVIFVWVETYACWHLNVIQKYFFVCQNDVFLWFFIFILCSLVLHFPALHFQSVPLLHAVSLKNAKK